MNPREKENLLESFIASCIFHFILFLLLAVLIPPQILKAGEVMGFVRIGVWEIETGISGEPSATKKKMLQPREEKGKQKTLTVQQGKTSAEAGAEGAEEEGYNPADYPGDHEAGLLSSAPAIYPKTAQNLGYQGTVRLRILVDVNGHAKDVKLLKSSGYEILDKAAVRSVKNWRFDPKVFKGKKVEGWIEVEVPFTL